MLIDYLVNTCKQDFNMRTCFPCNHPCQCPNPGYCKDCLEEIHYPARHPQGKHDYDCLRLMDFYVCDYSYKYASEYLYLLNATHAPELLQEYFIVSVGCGPCTDLIAWEKYNHDSEQNKEIRYLGVDLNKGWSEIHNSVKCYCAEESHQDIKTGFVYEDVSSLPEDLNYGRVNIISLQYVVSSIFQAGGGEAVYSFFDLLVNKIVLRRNLANPFLILINDVNSNKMGRDCFIYIVDALNHYGISSLKQLWYFNRNIINPGQCYGNKHNSSDILFPVSSDAEYFQPWEFCSSAQLAVLIAA